MSDNWRKLENYVFPFLGSMPIKEITAPIAIQILRPVEAQGKLEMVKRCGQLMNEVMNYAVNSGLIDFNPLVGINKVIRKPKVTHLRAMEPDDIKELMQAIASANIYFGTRCLIEWQLHTMVRPAEAAGTKWCEIDIEKAVWVIPPERMKMNREHKVPLTKQALAILEAVRPLSGHLEHVFPSRYKYRQATDSETINKALGRMGLRNKTTAHGFRSLASTTLNEKGFHPEAVDAALAHVEPNKIRAAYKRTTYFKKRKKIMQWWSDHISKHAIGSYQFFDRKSLSEALIQTK
ncbi:tyrosine-type recombinase/integrase [Parashewanella curva]|uniref:tyrosine-type recombinase/integrase n=1 Tax=Parashewanella curva TaxID=2338552 RepID=UPI003A598E0C